MLYDSFGIPRWTSIQIYKAMTFYWHDSFAILTEMKCSYPEVNRDGDGPVLLWEDLGQAGGLEVGLGHEEPHEVGGQGGRREQVGDEPVHRPDWVERKSRYCTVFLNL